MITKILPFVQMLTPENIRPVNTTTFGLLNGQFFRQVRRREVYFACTHGQWVFSFPVQSDGKISHRESDHNFFDAEVVEVLDQKDLGIAKAEWIL